MIFHAIHKLHDFMLSYMMEWCSSYRAMMLTIWLCLIMILYIIFLTLFKSWLHSCKGDDIVRKLCKSIEENNIVACVKLLEVYPSFINTFTKDGYTPFLIACANGNTQLVKLMLRKGADINLKSMKQESAFYLAAFYYIQNPQLKNATCIRELYYAGANINETNARCLTPLQMAAMFGHTALVKWLLTKKAATNTIPDPYVIACTQGHQDTANVIWKHLSGIALDYK